MNADHFRNLYDYHFAMNRKLWDTYVVTLSDEQYTQEIPYSVGSIRNHVVHMANIDDRWFHGLRGLEPPGFVNAANHPSREDTRAEWDRVEADMRAYLEQLTDDDLDTNIAPDMDVWQVMLHVVNHGTDHRAQLLAMLNTVFGIETNPQDYALWLFGRL